jgi:hypothetical protein
VGREHFADGGWIQHLPRQRFGWAIHSAEFDAECRTDLHGHDGDCGTDVLLRGDGS